MELVFTMDGWRTEPGINSKEGEGAENTLSNPEVWYKQMKESFSLE